MERLFVLQISDEEYTEITAGARTFIVVKNNRDFEIGDEILFDDLDGRGFEDWRFNFTITHILKGTGKNGIKKGYCVLGIERKFLRRIIKW